MPGQAYQLWLGSDGEWTAVDEQFWRTTACSCARSWAVARYDAIWITEETIGSVPSEPSTDGRTWQGAAPAARVVRPAELRRAPPTSTSPTIVIAAADTTGISARTSPRPARR